MQIPILREVKFPPKQLKGMYCHAPFMSIHINIQGNVGLCWCPGWHPTKIGNIFKSTIEEMLSSPVAIRIRESIINGSYIYCNEKRCPDITSILKGGPGLSTIETTPPDIVPLYTDSTKFIMPRHISMAGDLTCNLSCPSCRTEIRKMTQEEKDRFQVLGNILNKNLLSTPTDQPITIMISTAGELFASPMLLEFIGSIKKADFPNLKLNVLTNGLMCEKNWHRLNELQDAIALLTISVDATKKETYEKLRRGGTWEKLNESMAFLQQKKIETNFKFCVRMVVQKENYKEIEDFYKFGKSYGADRIEYNRIENWGSRTHDDHFAEDVFDPAHPEYEKACAELDKIKIYSDLRFTGDFP